MRGNEIVQELVQVGTVDVVIRRTVIHLQDLAPRCESDPFAGVVPPVRDALRSDSDLVQAFPQAPLAKQPGGIGAELHARADLPYYGGRFDDGHAMACLREAKRSSQTTDAATHHDDIENE